jgi:hypothetical protein
VWYRLARIEVNSTAINAVSHDGASLTVEFKDGSAYRYDAVSENEFQKLVSAESVGWHFNKHIRPQYDGARIG